MALMDWTGGVSPLKRREAREMRLMLLAVYPLCLGAALVARLLRRDATEASPRRSVFAEAQASASACIPFVFR